jgi:hypothetical protein
VPDLLAQHGRPGVRYLLNTMSDSRFHVIVELQTETGPDAWTEEWFPTKAQAIEFGKKLFARLADSCPEQAPKVIVYDNQGPRDNEERRITRIQLSEVSA